MIRRPPRSTLLTHSFPTRRSSDLPNNCVARFPSLSVRLDNVAHGERRTRGIVAREAAHAADAMVVPAAAFEHVDAHMAPSRAAVTTALRIADRAADSGAHACFVAVREVQITPKLTSLIRLQIAV